MAYETRLGAGIRQLGDVDSYRMLRGKDLDITEADALTSLADADIFLVDDNAAGTQASTNKITAANLKTYINNGMSPIAGSSSITTLGTITTGTWNAIAITHDYIGLDAIDGTNIADNAINSEHYTDGSIDHEHLAADAVDGDNIADDSIDSEHYVNGSIDTAHIADDQVTLAKMAGITRGSIIIGDASGNPAALALGSDNYVLTSDGSDIGWEAAAAGVTVSDSTANANFPVVFHDESNNLHDDTGAFHYNPNTGKVTATQFSGAFAGNITGNVTGNADTVTTIPSLSGEVSNSGNSVTIADNIIDEANLKVSNAPTNGYVLTAQSGDTGGLTWAEAAGGVSGDSFATDLKIGRDAHNHIDFTTDDEIRFRVSDDIGVTMKASGEIEATSLDLPGLNYATSTLSLSQTQTNNAILELKNTNTDTSGSILKFIKDSSSPAQIDTLGKIEFYGEDAGSTQVQFGEIRSIVVATSATDYAGSLYFDVAKDGNISNSGLAIKGRFAESVVDVDLGYGATSLTTVTGTLTMGSTATLDNNGLIQVAGQTNITSLGTLTSLDVDSVNINDKTITITGDTNDTFTITTGAGGATTLTTTDAGVLGGDFEIDADGAITLDAAGDIYLEPATNVHVAARGFNINSGASTSPALSITNEHDGATGPQIVLKNLRDGNGLEDGDSLGQINFSGDDAAGNVEGYATIEGSVVEADHGDECGKLQLSVANNGTLQNGITMTASSAVATEVDVNIGNGASSVTTVAGTLTPGGIYMPTGGIQLDSGYILLGGNMTITGRLELGHGSDTTFLRSDSGVVSIEDKEIVTKNKIYDFKVCTWWSNVTTGYYVPFGGTLNESTSLSSSTYSTIYTAPFDGKIVRIAHKEQSSIAGTSKLELFLDHSGTQTGDDMDVSSYTDKFQQDCPANWTFSKGQTIAIKKTDSTFSYGSNMTVVFEFDATT